MKRLAQGLLAIVFLCNIGCVTDTVLSKTRPSEKWNEKTQKSDTVPGNRAYYVLVPVTLAFDVATAPVWLPFVLIYGQQISQ